MNSIQQDGRMTARPGAAGGEALITVAVVEDSPTVRRNLNRWLDRTPGFKCVCTCANGVEALRVIPGCQPRVVLMDIQMPEMSGVECTAQLRQLLPAAQIIVLTVYEDTETIFKALRAGACGYLLKRSSHQEILHAMREILQGGAPMTSAIARKLVTVFQEPVHPADHIALAVRDDELSDEARVAHVALEALTSLDDEGGKILRHGQRHTDGCEHQEVQCAAHRTRVRLGIGALRHSPGRADSSCRPIGSGA